MHYARNPYLIDVGGSTIITRMCQDNSAALAGECQESNMFGMEMEVCVCSDMDGCNSALGSTKASFFVLSVLCAISIMIM